MLQQIPTHLVAGPLGAGKTSLIRHLLGQRPATERWAVLVNEFGLVGLDAALLAPAQADGVTLSEIAGGCLCCVAGAPFQVGLARLLRQARPDRLFIEPSGLGHPRALLAQLGEAPWQGVLALQPPVLVLDAAALARGEVLPASQQDALALAGLAVLNKADALGPAQRTAVEAGLPAGLPTVWTCQGQLPLASLPRASTGPGPAAHELPAVDGPSRLPAVWADPEQPLCQSGGGPDGWSIGWRWHPARRWSLPRLGDWLAQLDWQRAKLVVHGENDWCSANLLPGQPLAFAPSEWRRDSRLELIFAAPQDPLALGAGLAACRVG